MTDDNQIKNPKTILNRSWIIFVAITIILIAKYLLGYKFIILFDISALVILLSLIVLNFFIKKTIILYRILSFLILIYSMFGLLLPALEFINITYTIVASLTYLIPLVIYMLLVKKTKRLVI